MSHLWKSKDNPQTWVSLSTIWVQRVKLRSAGLQLLPAEPTHQLLFSLFQKNYFTFMYLVCVCPCRWYGSVCVCAWAMVHTEVRGQFAGVSSLLLPWSVPGTELRPWALTARVFACWAISPAYPFLWRWTISYFYFFNLLTNSYIYLRLCDHIHLLPLPHHSCWPLLFLTHPSCLHVFTFL